MAAIAVMPLEGISKQLPTALFAYLPLTYSRLVERISPVAGRRLKRDRFLSSHNSSNLKCKILRYSPCVKRFSLCQVGLTSVPQEGRSIEDLQPQPQTLK